MTSAAKIERRLAGFAWLALIALLAVALFSLTGCGGGSKDDDEDLTYVELPVELIYEEAFKRLRSRRYTDAAKVFDEVERQHPYSVWARRAMLMSAFSYYQANRYEDAIEAADRFISLHPGSKDAPYAFYLKAVCYYEQISDVGRDQERTLQALNALQDVVRRYPTSEYARDARLKIDLTRDHLAGKEMYVGRYYLNKGQYVGAINRFKAVIETYQTTSHVPEALERLTEAYFAIGLNDEAQASAAVLGYNFPDSEWYKDAYSLLVQRGLNRRGTRAQPASVRQLEQPRPVPTTPVLRAPTPPMADDTGKTPAEQPPEAAPAEKPMVGTPPAPAPTESGTAPPPATTATATPAQQAPVPAPAPADQYTGFRSDDLRDTWTRRLFRSLF